MKISTPDEFCMQIKFGKSVQKKVFVSLTSGASFPREKPIMQSEKGDENSLVSYSLPVILTTDCADGSFSQKTCVFTDTHTQFRFLSIRVQSWCQLPASCMSKPLGGKRTWIDSLFIVNLHNKKSLFFMTMIEE